MKKTVLEPLRSDPDGSRRRLAVAALCAVQVVDVLGVTVVVAALPAMLVSLNASPSAAGLVATTYAMCFGGLLLLGARLGDRYGHRRVLLLGLVLFAGASAIAGSAPSLAMLVVSRGLQGAAAAACVPAALRLLSVACRDEGQRRRALGAWSAAGASAGATGLVAGGLLTGLAGWRAVFWLNLPLAAALILMVLRAVPSGARAPKSRLDVLGAGLFTAAVMGLVLGASLLEQPASRAAGAVLVGAGALLLAIFARAQRIVPEPLLPAAAARSTRLRVGAGGAFLNTATTSSVVTLATLYLQDARGVSSAAAGLRLVPFSICVVLGSTVAGRMLAQRDPGVGLTAGLGMIAIGDAGLLAVPVADGLLSVCVAIAGLGIGMSSVAATALGTNVPGELQGAAAGILNSAAQVGTALGVSAAVLIAASTEHVPFPIHGTRLSWALAALLAASGSLLALRRVRGGVRRPSPGRCSFLSAQDKSDAGDAIRRG